MSNQIRFCTHCGAPLSEGALFCVKCGKQVVQAHMHQTPQVQYSGSSYTQPVSSPSPSPSYYENGRGYGNAAIQQPYNTSEPMYDVPVASPKKKQKSGKSGLLRGILISLAIIVVCESFNGVLSGMGLGSENIAADRYIECIESYEPGEISNDTYTSRFWDFSFEADGKWEMFSDSALDKDSEEHMAEVKESISDDLEQVEIYDEELVEKCKEATYCRLEMAARYVNNSSLAGEVYFLVLSKASVNESTLDTYVENMADTYRESSDDVEVAEESFGGNDYKEITYTSKVDGETVENYIYVRCKGNMVNMINVVYYEGHDEVMESFLKNVND